jgi:Zn-dependent protease with chaperone function
MMFYVLAICLCLAVSFLLLAGASLFTWTLRGLVSAIVRVCAPATAARILFMLRMLPLFLAIGFTLGLALPAFLKFEPRSTSESIGAKLLLLAMAGAAVLMLMAARALRMLRATMRSERRWGAGCQAFWVDAAGRRLPLYLVDGPLGLVAVTGFFRPKLFVSKEVAQALSWEELSAALAHEVAHVRFHDNLKRLLLKTARPPRWLRGNLDEAWTKVTGVAADEAAIVGGVSPLDRAAALVKTSTLRRGHAACTQIAASHLVPETIGSAMEMRVARLHQALQGEVALTPANPLGTNWKVLGTVALSLAAYIAAVSTLLPAVHEVLEFLVR